MVDLLPMTATGALSRRRGTTLVGPIDLTLGAGGITVVIGPNGSGKTSLLRMLHGIARLNAGQIDWACDLAAARKGQAFVFQRPIALRRSVLENVAYPMRVAGNRREANQAAEQWIDRVGLGYARNRRATQLSGGEAQKMALARALVTGPQLVFLDEPTASLDGRATREIEELLKGVRDDGTTLVLSTHDMGQARRLADTVWFLRGGQLHEAGAAAAFFAGPQTSAAKAFLNGDIVE